LFDTSLPRKKIAADAGLIYAAVTIFID